MLRFAEQYREVIDAITSNKTYGLRKFELDDDEWKVVGDLVYVFKTATLFFSSDAISTISNVISTMDAIDDILQSRGDRKLQPAVLRAVALGRATLQRYYQKTDASDIYRLALVLHPSSKLECYRTNGFDADWISDTENMLRKQYKAYSNRMAKNRKDTIEVRVFLTTLAELMSHLH
ncbi:hypothetical protein DFH08DRAFT_713067 [Mycena albidolilacea]|uniref:Uncharacterized protein n=1 Tax=Mycena albidolilacea TaxID=1033008 RepID=A0AAD7EFZ0_9AGAR|nr:hypothetical protein DFH08DRAFT_713067 [Mycena albidolilacea]